MGAHSKKGKHWGWGKRIVVGAGALIVVAGAAVAVTLVLGRPRVSLSSSGRALVDVHLGGFGTKLTGVQASSDGRPVALVRDATGMVPVAPLDQGRDVRVTATATAPSWLQWLLGGRVSTTRNVRTSAAAPSTEVVLASSPGQVPVLFDNPVSVVDYRSAGGPSQVIHLPRPATVAYLTVPPQIVAGSLRVAAAPQPWETVAATPSTVTWFTVPAGGGPVALADPAPGSATAATNAPITLTFDEPVTKLFGTVRPTLSPAVAGTWSNPGADTLVFTPSGFGFGPDVAVTVTFDQAVSVLGEATAGAASTTAADASTTYHFRTAPGSLLRLQQILAQLQYLPLNFVPDPGVTMPTTFEGELATIDQPLAGTFTWRYPSTPSALQAQWTPGTATVMTKGALMTFAAQGPYDGYTLEAESVAQLANGSTWKALLQAAVANQLDPDPYSYVYVTETIPEILTLWQNGTVVLTSRANTGIAGDPTPIGTFPIYLRYTVNYMSGTNPNGTPYHDLVHWINYFSGGSAVHGFVRRSYGFPQSLACVELPVPTAATVFSHLAIGDLVTVT